MAWGGVASAAVAWGQAGLWWWGGMVGNGGELRAHGLAGSPLILGPMMALAGVGAVGVLRWPWWRVAVVFGPPVWFAGSRAGMAGVLLAWGMMWARGGGHGRRCLVALAALVGTLAIGSGREWRGGSDAGRVIVWAAALDGWKDRPWLGHGPASFARVADSRRGVSGGGGRQWQEVYRDHSQDNAHNLALEALCSTGALGALALAGLLASALWAARGDPLIWPAAIAYAPTALVNPLMTPLPALFVLIVAVAVPKSEPRGGTWPMRLCAAAVIAGYAWFYERDRTMVLFNGPVADRAFTQAQVDLGLLYWKIWRGRPGEEK